MHSKLSRRSVLRGGLIAGTLIPVAGLSSFRADAALPALDPNDATAKALGFVTDATKVDASTNPTFKPTQKCGTCAQYQGKPSDANAACNIFSGKSVPTGGWCKVWVQKS